MTLKKNDRLSELDLMILPAIFARSNMGHGLPDASAVAADRRRTTTTLQGCVIHYAGHLMETDEHEEMFLEEARSWVKTLRRDGKSKTCQFHPDIGALYWGPEDPAVVAGRSWNEMRMREIRSKRRGR